MIGSMKKLLNRFAKFLLQQRLSYYEQRIDHKSFDIRLSRKIDAVLNLLEG